jgi:hypothetical protein
MHKWSDSVNKSLYGTGNKSRVNIEKPLNYHNNAKPLTDVQKMGFVPESSQKTKDLNIKNINDGFNRLRK